MIIRAGDPRCVDEIKANSFKIKLLENFSYTEDGTERGNGVREKAKLVIMLINDPELLESEREAAKKIRSKVGATAGIGTGASSPGKYGGISSTGANYASGRGGDYGGYSSPTVPGVSKRKGKEEEQGKNDNEDYDLGVDYSKGKKGKEKQKEKEKEKEKERPEEEEEAPKEEERRKKKKKSHKHKESTEEKTESKPESSAATSAVAKQVFDLFQFDEPAAAQAKPTAAGQPDLLQMFNDEPGTLQPSPAGKAPTAPMVPIRASVPAPPLADLTISAAAPAPCIVSHANSRCRDPQLPAGDRPEEASPGLGRRLRLPRPHSGSGTEEGLARGGEVDEREAAGGESRNYTADAGEEAGTRGTRRTKRKGRRRRTVCGTKPMTSSTCPRREVRPRARRRRRRRRRTSTRPYMEDKGSLNNDAKLTYFVYIPSAHID